MKLVDMTDSKSVARNSVPVQVRPLVPFSKPTLSRFFCAWKKPLLEILVSPSAYLLRSHQCKLWSIHKAQNLPKQGFTYFNFLQIKTKALISLYFKIQVNFLNPLLASPVNEEEPKCIVSSILPLTACRQIFHTKKFVHNNIVVSLHIYPELHRNLGINAQY